MMINFRNLILLVVLLITAKGYAQFTGEKLLKGDSLSCHSSVVKENKFSVIGFSPQKKKVNVNGIMFNFFPNKTPIVTNGIELNLNPMGPLLFAFSFPYIIGSKNIRLPWEARSDSVYKTYKKINGLHIALFNMEETVMNGFELSLNGSRGTIANGVSIGVLLNQRLKLNGIGVGLYNSDTKVNGVQLGFVNVSDKTRGFQFGLWNKNEKRSLPLVNWNSKD